MNGSNVSEQWKYLGEPMPRLHQTPGGIALVSVLSTLATLIVLANTLVFLLMAKRPRLRTPTNFILVSLAASDLLAGSVVIPLVMACACTGFRPDVCLSMDLCQRFLSISTILHLLVATLERHLKIRQPLTYPRLVNKRRAITILLVTWAFSLTTSLIQLFWVNVTAGAQELIQIRRIEVIYTSLCLTVLVLVPFLLMVAAYLHMFLIIKRETRRRKLLTQSMRSNESQAARRRKENERRVVVVYLAMFISFVLGWFPYFLLSLFNDLLLMEFMAPFWVDFVLIVLKFGTAFVNPVLYTFFKSDFQKGLKAITTNHCCNTNNRDYEIPLTTAISQTS